MSHKWSLIIVFLILHFTWNDYVSLMQILYYVIYTIYSLEMTAV